MPPFPKTAAPFGPLAHLFVLGSCSGIPFFLVLSTLGVWLCEAGHSPTMVGLCAWATLPYALKFLWSPYVDFIRKTYGAPGIRLWALLMQGGVIITTFLMGVIPFPLIMMAAFLLCFCAASVDMVMDSLRMELFQQSGRASAIETAGFRFGTFVGGAITLYMAAWYDWPMAYQMMAVVQLAPLISLWRLSRHLAPVGDAPQTQSFLSAFVGAFQQSRSLFTTPLVCFIVLFKTPGTLCQAMSYVFFHHLGCDKIAFATLTKTYTIPIVIAGCLVSGMMNMRRAIYIIVGCQCVIPLLFLGHYYYGIQGMWLTISLESFISGMASTALIAFVSQFCQKPYLATQFTVLYGIHALGRNVFSSVAGVMVQYMGWPVLFGVACGISVLAYYAFQKTPTS